MSNQIHSELRFEGSDFSQKLDGVRLTGQIQRVYGLMKDERWRTLNEISVVTGDPPASVSAQLRHLRKPRFGGHTVQKRRRGEECRGLWEYRLLLSLSNESPGEVTESNLDYSDGCVRLRHGIPYDEWIEVNERLKRRGYRYWGNGVWKKSGK